MVQPPAGSSLDGGRVESGAGSSRGSTITISMRPAAATVPWRLDASYSAATCWGGAVVSNPPVPAPFGWELSFEEPRGRLPGGRTVSDDRFVAKDSVLHASLPLVSRRLLPSSTSQSLHSCDRPIPRTRPWSPPRHRRRLGRRNHDPGTSRPGRLVERDGLVGGVRGHARDVPVHLLDQTDAGRRVIGCRLRDRLGNDYAGAVDTEVQLLPAALAAGPVLYGGPLAFADDRQSCAIDDEMHRSLGRNAIECQIEMLTPTRERRVIRCLEGRCASRPARTARSPRSGATAT